jgi:hypothetical protein
MIMVERWGERRGRARRREKDLAISQPGEKTKTKTNPT